MKAKTSWVLCLVLGMSAVVQASFVLDGATVSAPGTYWWGGNTTGWTIDSGCASNSTSGFFDGLTNYLMQAGSVSPVARHYQATGGDGSLICVFNLGKVYKITSIGLAQGPDNGYWGNLSGEIRLSQGTTWEGASSVGSVGSGGFWISPPGQTVSYSWTPTGSAQYAQYIFLQVGYTQGSLAWDELNVVASSSVPEPLSLILMSVSGMILARRKA